VRYSIIAFAFIAHHIIVNFVRLSYCEYEIYDLLALTCRNCAVEPGRRAVNTRELRDRNTEFWNRIARAWLSLAPGWRTRCNTVCRYWLLKIQLLFILQLYCVFLFASAFLTILFLPVRITSCASLEAELPAIQAADFSRTKDYTSARCRDKSGTLSRTWRPYSPSYQSCSNLIRRSR